MLTTKRGFVRAIPTPAVLGRSALWPQRLTVTCDENAAVYEIALSEFLTTER